MIDEDDKDTPTELANERLISAMRVDNKADTLIEVVRRPYVPPAVEESGSFERLVLSCAHVPMGRDNCHPQPVRS